jgi:hypothetical protein
MSSMPTIEITISPDGETTVQTQGIVGPACREASRWVELALGEKLSETLSPEFFQTQAASQPLTHKS